jgi:hypothetical protein
LAKSRCFPHRGCAHWSHAAINNQPIAVDGSTRHLALFGLGAFAAQRDALTNCKDQKFRPPATTSFAAGIELEDFGEILFQKCVAATARRFDGFVPNSLPRCHLLPPMR